ncbi:MAG: SusC/RagA family TonB-linked outer membrane protein [Mangrovibacterium sp.]
MKEKTLSQPKYSLGLTRAGSLHKWVLAVFVCGFLMLQGIATVQANPHTVVQENAVTVTGTVVGDDGIPIPGVTVFVKGTANGTTTNVDGEYAIEISGSSGTVLTYSFVGFETQDIPYGGNSKINVTLSSDTEEIDEVVVVAYGTRKKGTIAGSVSTVKGERLESVPAAGFDQALQGSTPGLTVMTNSGEPSATASFKIRGTNSINSGTAPLFILDGVPISSSDFNTINPGDIESISVLKDASSTSIYGARAANGVVVVTTKRGRLGAPKISLRTQFGVSQLAGQNWDLMNTSERIQYEKELGLDAGQDYERLSRINTNWRDEVFNDAAPLQSYELSASGGSKDINYFFSANFFDQDGIAPGSFFTRYATRANVEINASEKLKLGTNTMLTYEDYEQTQSGSYYTNTPISASRFMLPYLSPYNDDGTLASVNDGSWKGTGMLQENPLEWMANNQTENQKYKAISTIYAQYSPTERWTIRSQLGIDFTQAGAYMTSNPSYLPNGGEGQAGRNTSTTTKLTMTNTAAYKFKHNDVHSFNFLVGQEGVNYSAQGFNVMVAGQTNDALMDISSATRATSWQDALSEFAYVSFFGRGEYDYLGKYYADFSIRTDGSSRFGKDNRWATFWSVGLMWNARQEDFFKSKRWLSNLQVAFSTGTSGNSTIPNYDHLALVSGGADYLGDAGIAPTQRGAENLSWEKLWSTNLALRMGFLNKINVSVELYNKLTSDMLMSVPVSYADGGFGFQWDNVGAMVNRGLELSLDYTIMRKEKFTWSVNANASYNKNKLTELYGDVNEYTLSTTGTRLQVGHSIGEFYYVEYAGVNPNNGDALWYTKEGEVTNVYDENDRVMTGKSYIAPWQGGFGTTASYRGITLSAQFSWVGDRYVVNNDRYFDESNGLYTAFNQSKRLLYDRWKHPGDVTDIPRHGINPQFDTHLIENASFLRLKNLMISYNLPETLLSRTNTFKSARVYAQGQNLFTFTKFSGFDPEGTTGMYQAQYPMTRQFSFGLEVTF